VVGQPSPDGAEPLLAAGGAATRRLLATPAMMTLWGRGFDVMPGYQLYRSALELAGGFLDLAAGQDATPVVELVSWLGLHVYDLGASVELRGDRLIIRAAATTFAAEPEAARRAYHQALELRLRGDDAGWRQALGRLERDHAGTLVARQARVLAGRGGLGSVGMTLAVAIALAGGLD
jgi:hypothetical protein